MRPFATALSIVGFVVTLVPATVSAQQVGAGRLTKEGLATFTEDISTVLRFRQLGDTRTLGKGHGDVGVQFATASIDGWKGPRIAGRFGLTDRVDLGAWGGMHRDANYGLIGADFRIALLQEGPGRPVSVSVRPSISSMIGSSDIWAASTSVDLTVSRAFGPWSPYAGVAATSSFAMDRLKDVDLDPATAGSTQSYAGLSYRWRALVASAEVERGTKVSYAFRVGTRF